MQITLSVSFHPEYWSVSIASSGLILMWHVPLILAPEVNIHRIEAQTPKRLKRL